MLAICPDLLTLTLTMLIMETIVHVNNVVLTFESVNKIPLSVTIQMEPLQELLFPWYHLFFNNFDFHTLGNCQRDNFHELKDYTVNLLGNRIYCFHE